RSQARDKLRDPVVVQQEPLLLVQRLQILLPDSTVGGSVMPRPLANDSICSSQSRPGAVPEAGGGISWCGPLQAPTAPAATSARIVATRISQSSMLASVPR